MECYLKCSKGCFEGCTSSENAGNEFPDDVDERLLKIANNPGKKVDALAEALKQTEEGGDIPGDVMQSLLGTGSSKPEGGDDVMAFKKALEESHML